MTPPIHAMSNSWLVYLEAALTLSWLIISLMSACVGNGVGLLEDSFFSTGLGLLEMLGVLLSVGAAELNFWRSMLEAALSKSAFSMSTKVIAMLSSSCVWGGWGEMCVEIGAIQERSTEIYRRFEKALAPGYRRLLSSKEKLLWHGPR